MKKFLFILFFISLNCSNNLFPMSYKRLYPEVNNYNDVGKVRVIIENRTNLDLGTIQIHNYAPENTEFSLDPRPSEPIIYDYCDFKRKDYIRNLSRGSSPLLPTDPKYRLGIIADNLFSFYYIFEPPIKTPDGLLYRVSFKFSAKGLNEKQCLRTDSFLLEPNQADVYLVYIIFALDADGKLGASCMLVEQKILDIN